MSQPSYDSDFLLASACLSGDSTAVADLQKLIAERVTPFVIKGGAPPKEAADLLAELLSDLVLATSARPPLLRKYVGQCALTTWIARVAINRWLDLTRRQKNHPVLPMPEFSETVAEEPPPALHEDEEPLVAILRQAIQAAFADRPPEDFVLFRLLHEQGLYQTELALIFGFDRRTVARHSERIGAELRTDIMNHVRTLVPEMHLDWEDLIELIRAAGSDIWSSE